MEQRLMTPAEFSALVRRWAAEIKTMAQASLAAGTHGSGQLRERMEAFVDSTTHLTASMENDGVEVPYKVKFGFDRYGVFRAYGVGRGWVRIGGVLTRGFRARSEREIRNREWNIFTTDLRKKGLSTAEINGFKFFARDTGSNRVRTPLDWIDRHINHHITTLADHVQQFYGDEAMRQLLEEVGKIRIVKKNNMLNIS